jgi:hypothetical protein
MLDRLVVSGTVSQQAAACRLNAASHIHLATRGKHIDKFMKLEGMFVWDL